MNDDEWKYVGPGSIHNATIEAVERNGSEFSIQLRIYEGVLLKVLFTGVQHVIENEPIGMMVYSLSKRVAPAPPYQYSFPNWDEGGKPRLEIVAEAFEIDT
jgi:hypothetical protein